MGSDSVIYISDRIISGFKAQVIFVCSCPGFLWDVHTVISVKSLGLLGAAVLGWTDVLKSLFEGKNLIYDISC